MTLDQVLQEITSGLKGDPKHDVKYLMEQSEKYKEHEYSKEILRAIGRIIHELVPQELKDTFDNEYKNFNLSIEKTLEEVDFQMYKSDFNKALELTKELIKKIEEIGFYKDDQVSEYHCFNNIVEEILYMELFNPKKTIRPIPVYYAVAYFRHGQLLFEHKKLDEARKPLEIAEKYNPMDIGTKTEIAETYKLEKNWDKFLSINKQIHECLFTNDDLCRYYRNLGYYYIEQEKYDIAMALYIVSLLYFQISETPELATAQNQKMFQFNMIKNQLEYIISKTGKDINFDYHLIKDCWKLYPKFDSSFKNTEWHFEIQQNENNKNEAETLLNIKALLEKNNISFGPNEKVLTILKNLGQDLIYKKENVGARAVHKLLLELTNNEMYERVIKALPKTNRTKTSKKGSGKKGTSNKGKKKKE